jgi:hypothetical protein
MLPVTLNNYRPQLASPPSLFSLNDFVNQNSNFVYRDSRSCIILSASGTYGITSP